MTQLHDRKHFLGGLNKDDDPAKLPEGDYQDGLNVRTQSSEQQHGAGPAETMQSEIEILIDVEAPAYYGGLAIGGDFIYTGYSEVQIGGQVWMKKNWDFNFPGSKVYNNDEANRAIYGGLYKWEHIQRANFCPAGWHIPTEAEVDALLEYLGGALIAGGRMKEPDDLHWNLPNNGADDFSGFKGLPGGMFDTIFKLLRQQAKFWINDEWNPPVPGSPPDETLRDYDGNPYSTVIINGREWIIENLRTTHYADGTPILNIAGYNDWFLPSRDELQAVYDEVGSYGLINIGVDGNFWSSSEFDANYAYTLNFFTNVMSTRTKGNSLAILPIRTFQSTTIHALRDFVYGGYVFHITDEGGGLYTYYMVWPSPIGDFVDGDQWSNITNVLIGTTGTAIGTGQANTNVIIGQAGHIDSAAKICDDITSEDLWAADEVGAYCWYNNDIANKDIFGALYNWHVVNNAHGLAYLKRTGVQEAGWRVATLTDFTELKEYLGGDPLIFSLGDKVKEASTDHWSSPNTGTNETMLSMRGGGRRISAGVFDNLMNLGHFWSATEQTASFAHLLRLINSYGHYFLTTAGKENGHSVRLVRDV